VTLLGGDVDDDWHQDYSGVGGPANAIHRALHVLHQSVMCWWNVFQCSTFLYEQLLARAVHRSTGACPVI